MKMTISLSFLAAMFAAIYAIPAYSDVAIAALAVAQFGFLMAFRP